MTLIKKDWKMAVALAASFVALPSLAQAEKGSDGVPEVIELPIEGKLYMRATETGSPVITTKDGRFVLPAQFVDRNSGSELVTTMEKAWERYGEGSGSDSNGSSKAPTDIDMDSKLGYSVGSGPQEAYVFVDPTCPHCHTVLKMQQELKDEYTFHNIIIPVLGPKAEEAVNNVSCIPEKNRESAILNRNYGQDAQTQECDVEGMKSSLQAARKMGVKSVPVIVNPQGRQVAGAPRSKQAFVQFLERGQ